MVMKESAPGASTDTVVTKKARTSSTTPKANGSSKSNGKVHR